MSLTGFDVWQVKRGTMVDQRTITDNDADADVFVAKGKTLREVKTESKMNNLVPECELQQSTTETCE